MTKRSRKAVEFLKRHGLADARPQLVPRLPAGRLRLHHIPLQRRLLRPSLLADAAAGADRGRTDEWLLQEAVSYGT